MEKIIIYYGICFLPDKNAMCQRAFSICDLIVKNGYVPVIIGFNRENKTDITYINDIKCYSIPYPHSNKEWLMNLFSINRIKQILLEIDPLNIQCIIASDLRFMQIIELNMLCKRNSITYVPDILDWYAYSKNNSIKSLVRNIDIFLTMNFSYRLFKKILVVSRNLEKKYNSKKRQCIRIPMTYIKKEKIPDKEQLLNNINQINFIFCGQPGMKCEKEKLDWIIKAFSHTKYDYKLYILGITKEELLINNSYLKQYIDNSKMIFLGICSHKETVEIMKKCDFGLLIREKNRLSDYGFSTKLMESFKYNLPLLATNTSDVPCYIQDGYNGFLCEANEKAFKKMLSRIFEINIKDLKNMKKNMIDEKLDNSLYVSDLKKII